MKEELECLRNLVDKLQNIKDSNIAISDKDKEELTELFTIGKACCKEFAAQISMFNLFDI